MTKILSLGIPDNHVVRGYEAFYLILEEEVHSPKSSELGKYSDLNSRMITIKLKLVDFGEQNGS
jgi:hypothetical protein